MYVKKCCIRYLAILFMLSPAGVYATSWSCMHDEKIREVIIEYPDGGTLPCKVIYNKPTEGFDKSVLWQADNVEGFCEEKANEMVNKLESWGWKCYGEVDSEQSAAETEAGTESETEAATEAATEAESVTDIEAQ